MVGTIHWVALDRKRSLKEDVIRSLRVDILLCCFVHDHEFVDRSLSHSDVSDLYEWILVIHCLSYSLNPILHAFHNSERLPIRVVGQIDHPPMDMHDMHRVHVVVPA